MERNGVCSGLCCKSEIWRSRENKASGVSQRSGRRQQPEVVEVLNADSHYSIAVSGCLAGRV